MTLFKIVLSASSVAVAAASVIYVRHIVKVSGRDQPHDPELVRQFIASAPLHRLKDTLK